MGRGSALDLTQLTARPGTGGRRTSPGGRGAWAAALLGPKASSFPPHPRATPSSARLLPARSRAIPAGSGGHGGEKGPAAPPAKLALAHTSELSQPHTTSPAHLGTLLPFRVPRLLRPLPTSLLGTGGPPMSSSPSPTAGRGCRTGGHNFRAEPWRKDPGLLGLNPATATAHKRPHPAREASGTLGGSGGEEEPGSRSEQSPGNRISPWGNSLCFLGEPAAARGRQRVLAACRGRDVSRARHCLRMQMGGSTLCSCSWSQQAQSPRLGEQLAGVPRVSCLLLGTGAVFRGTCPRSGGAQEVLGGLTSRGNGRLRAQGEVRLKA